MAEKFDGVIEAVRYLSNGQLDLVRVYERRGPAFSDHVLLDRQTLIQRLKKGKRFIVGERLVHLAGTFKPGARVKLAGPADHEFVVTGAVANGRDDLENVPWF